MTSDSKLMKRLLITGMLVALLLLGTSVSAIAPVANFTGTPTTGTAPLQVNFTDSSTNIPTVWLWTFGDGSAVNATVQNPLHTYLAPGTYTVSLTASNAQGSNGTTRTNYIVVSPAAVTPPVANFTGTPTTGNSPLLVNFTDSSTNIPTVWQWTFGDGSIENASVQNPLHTYAATGTYTVTLTASNAGGANSTTRTNYIVVSPAAVTPPVANFTGTPTTGTAPLLVNFTDSSTNTPTVWQWTFGDGSIENATVQNPMHTYLAPGTYTVTLTASNAGGSNSLTRTNYIVVSPAAVTPPVANFTGTPTTGTAPLLVNFTDSSTNTPTVWQWTFGDGSIENATVQNPMHTYLAPGTYTVTLTASNPGGSNSLTRTNYIVGSPAAVTPPVANFTGTPTTGIAPLLVNFTDSSTNTPTVWQWTFGDGSIENATVQNPMHTYLAPGTYTVTLTASNAGGSNSLTRTNYIVVSPAAVTPPVANFTGTPTTGSSPLTVNFIDSSTNTPTVWQWTFGDGSIENATVQNPRHTYLAVGNYTVSLMASNAGGSNTTTKAGYINVTNATKPTSIGIFQNGQWILDSNGDGVFTTGIDKIYGFGGTGYTPVVGDWNGDNRTKIGVFQNGLWVLDTNGDGVFTTGLDTMFGFGGTGYTPVVGDWNGNNRTKIGVFQNGLWILDTNGDGQFTAPVDTMFGFGGTGYTPVVGDWNGDNRTKIGVFQNGLWILDTNGDGLFTPGIDTMFGFGGTGYTPVVGDWNGDNRTEIGVFQNGLWILDMNGDGLFTTGIDTISGFGGTGYTPVVGDWDGNKRTKIGIFQNGQWVLDTNGDGLFTTGIDRIFGFGGPGYMPIVGHWI